MLTRPSQTRGDDSQRELHNFNAGPSTLPREVRERIKSVIDRFEGGPGILELSHRSPAFDRVVEEAKEAIRRVYQLPDTHEVLFLQGGASTQFAMVPFNLGVRGGFLTTGVWSQRALSEARCLTKSDGEGPVELLSAAPKFDHVFGEVSLPKDAVDRLDYIHLTSNNTIYGTQYQGLPTLSPQVEQLRQVGFVIDASSDIFSKAINWSQVDLMYAGAQKNAGPAGVTIVIGRKEVTRATPKHAYCPKIMAYRTHAERGSLYHTPNTLGIFAVGEVAKWVESLGGVEAMSDRAERRSSRVYEIIDHYNLYQGHARGDSRSRMNITFNTTSSEHETLLLERAAQRSMCGLKGHRSVGGLRVSLYNAVSDSSVDQLCELLEELGEEASR